MGRLSRRCVALAVFMMSAAQVQAAGLLLSESVNNGLKALHGNESLLVRGFPIGETRNADVRFRRVDIYAPDAHTYLMTAGGKQELPRSDHIFLRGYADDGSARVAMSLNAAGSFLEGNGSGADGSFVLSAHADAHNARTLNAKALESTLPSPDAFDFRCGNENVNLNPSPTTGDLASQLHLATSGSTAGAVNVNSPTLRYAIVGIDTDSLFMSRLFANNTTSATNWIASMFNTINTMYENDLQVQLQIGTTILRTSAASDPYTSLSTGAATQSELTLFGNYWSANESGVARSFAALLSGAIPSSGGGCSAAGIAWIDAYCQKGSSGGSYSVNKVCTSLAIDPAGSFDARIVGHEIGHNFGAYHTHCTNTSTGAAPTGSNTIDQCYNGESGSSCYAGATSCPAGQTSGTIMSYCNISGCGTQNQLSFHATQISDVLLPKISAHTPSCLSTIPDEIFKNGFGG